MDWGTAFGQSFNSSFESGQRRAAMRQEALQKQMYYDMTMASKGYAPLSEEEYKEMLSSLRKNELGYSAASGYVGLPQGSVAKDGIVYDNKGNQIGEYLSGSEGVPQPLVKLQMDNADIVNIGGRFYKYNKEYAKKFNVEEDFIDLNDINKKLQSTGLKGQVLPNTVRIGNQTFRYQPSMEEKAGIPSQITNTQQPIQTQATPTGQANPFTPAAQAMPTNQPVDANKQKMRGAILNAVNSGAPFEEVLAGIKEEGYKPEDFSDILKAYDTTKNVSSDRRSILSKIISNAGLSPASNQHMIKYFSDSIDNEKNKMRRR